MYSFVCLFNHGVNSSGYVESNAKMIIVRSVGKEAFIATFHVRIKVRPRTGHNGPEEEQRNSSTIALTSALDGDEWLTPRPGRFALGKETRHPLY
jgi:hypothetical protein